MPQHISDAYLSGLRDGVVSAAVERTLDLYLENITGTELRAKLAKAPVGKYLPTPAMVANIEEHRGWRKSR